MLQQLTIQNLATIEELTVEFAPGLNALTGETGAGKSILIEGLGLTLGQRASADAIRAGAALAVVEAQFTGPWPRELTALLRGELGLEWDGGEPLSIRREIARSGRNRCLVNGQMVAVADLARIGEWLVDFHGQHEHQSLLRRGAARDALDAYAGNEKLTAAYATAWEELTRLRRRREELEEAARDFEKRADFLDFQLDELDQLNPRPGELAELEQEEHRLAHAESLAADAAEAYALLYEGPDDDRPSLLAVLREVQRRVADLTDADPSFAEAVARIEDYRSGLEDLAYSLRDFAETTQADPERLNEVIERLEALRRVIRKHGGTEEALAEAWQTMRAERERMSLDQEERRTIDRQLEKARAALNDAAARLTAARTSAAERFARDVLKLLRQLNMEKARFEVRVTPLDAPAAHGADDVEFLLAANPGLPPAPLRRVGSGGELSRVMLALKSTLAARDRIPTLVFDEIDTGVSGETARRVGLQLEALGASHQILCITHHAPIAARAAAHARVSKEVRGETTHTRVTLLDHDARLEELARMMGGDSGLATARKLAGELMA